MMIINNNDLAKSHFNVLIDLIDNSEELLIVSPFISSNVNIIPAKHLKKVKKLTVLTTLPRIAIEQEKKVRFFLHLLSLASQYNFALTILIDDSLHGKVYIGRTAGNYKAIITSANLTNRGLKTNNEWGVVLNDDKITSQIWQTITESPTVRELTPNEIHGYSQVINSNKITSHHIPVPAYDLQPPKIFPVIVNSVKNITYWLKPIGKAENPVPNSELHDTSIRDITFATKPAGLKKGDIVICYAAQRKYIMSVYVVEKEWFRNTYSQDYPYSIIGRNLFPYYGSEWYKRNITIDTIKAKIIASKPFKITPNGVNNYKRLQQADKMKVTPEYANLVMQELEIENNKIASFMMTD